MTQRRWLGCGVVSLLVFASSDAGSLKCRAPTAEIGSCGLTEQCPGIGRIRDPGYQRLFFCGYDGRVRLVCCPYRWTLDYLNRNQSFSATHASLESDGSPKRPQKPSLLPEKCGAASGIIVGRIKSGTEARAGEHPWMAAIYLDRLANWVQCCGGSLVSSTHVITAAHCVVEEDGEDIPPRRFLVRLGEHNLTAGNKKPLDSEKNFKIAKIDRHEQFSRSTYKNDIALMRLETPVTFSKNISPLCLPYDAVQGNLDNQFAIIAGWGCEEDGGENSGVLKQAVVRIWPESQCKEAYRGVVRITAEYICAKDGPRDACQGDSGGPLAFREDERFYLIGITSFGKKSDTIEYPGGYTKVTEYLDWLNGRF